MISDESSSDSETGRFKSYTKNQDGRSATKKEEQGRSLGRSRPGGRHDRFSRDFDRRKDDRCKYERHSRERERLSSHSTLGRSRYSRDRSLNRNRRSPDYRHWTNTRPRSRPRNSRSYSRDRKMHSRSISQKKTEPLKSLKDDLRETISVPIDNEAKNRQSISPDHRVKMSQVHKPITFPQTKKKSESPIHIIDEAESDVSEGTRPASYYNMIPVVKDKSEESSVTDSSDDEKLRAKLLNLEKELNKTRNKKRKKKHKKKSSKSKTKEKTKEKDAPATVEVTSTTDIQEKEIPEDTGTIQPDIVQVTSTQSKSNQKESSEEGEISSDDSEKGPIEIDPTDLRHKLKRTVATTERSVSPDLRERLKAKHDICGPALPPHLEKKFKISVSSDVEEVEGPILPPHLQIEKRNIGPAIPNEMRKILADVDHADIKCESSDEEGGLGPMPAGSADSLSEAHQKLEERALSMKIKQLDGHTLENSNVKSREQWMLELPEGKAKYLGLEARTFRAKEGPDMSDRSCWTDTPEQRARKEAGLPPEGETSIDLQREARAKQIMERDADYEKAVKKHKKKHKREESLLEAHQKKLKKKKMKEEKEAEGKKERRPFDRDVDLQVNRFDEAQKKAIIKKAQNLDSRFSSGEAKFL